jgi:SAM-dependent methyltransferase
LTQSFEFVERPDCPVCHAPGGESLYRSPFEEGPIAALIRTYYKVDPLRFGGAVFELIRCPTCSLIYQRWVGDEALMGELYGTWINEDCVPERDPVYQSAIAHIAQSRDAHEIAAVAAFLGREPRELSTLDYGMGWALWARIAQQIGCHSHGVELSPSRVAFAEAHGVHTLSETGLGRDRFDFINCEQVMEHVVDPRGLCEQLVEALAPGGILKISVPSAEKGQAVADLLKRAPAEVTAAQVMPVHPLEHVNGFTARSLKALGELLGLEMVRPSLRDRFAFLARPGSIRWSDPKLAIKELVRPIYQFHNPRNLYVWLRKSPA